jgi:hypothetical protein
MAGSGEIIGSDDDQRGDRGRGFTACHPIPCQEEKKDHN